MKAMHFLKLDVVIAIACIAIMASSLPVVLGFDFLRATTFYFMLANIYLGLSVYCLQEMTHLRLSQKTFLLSCILFTLSFHLRCFNVFGWLDPTWSMYPEIILQVLGFICLATYVFAEGSRLEKLSKNKNASANSVMLFIAFCGIMILGFSDYVMVVVQQYQWMNVLYFMAIIPCVWLLFLVIFFTIHSRLNLQINLLHLCMASLFTAFCILFSISQVTQNVAEAKYLDILSRVFIFMGTGFMMIYIRYREKVPDPIYRLETKTHYILLFSGMTSLILTIPLGYLIATSRHVHIPMPILAFCAVNLIIMLGVRLLLLLQSIIEQSNTFKFELQHDYVTGLPNRKYLLSMGEDSLSQARAVVMVDIHDFKSINDLYGYQVGDQLLKLFGHTLKEVVNDFLPKTKTAPIIARLASDEFAVVMLNVENFNEVAFLQYLQQNIPEWWQIEFNRIFMSFCVGISSQNADSQSTVSLQARIQEASFATSEAQRTKRTLVPRAQLNLSSLGNRQRVRQHVQDALAQNAVVIQMQPLFSLHTNAVWGLEAIICLQINNAIFYPEEYLDIIHSDHLYQKFAKALIHAFSLISSQYQDIPICINLPTAMLADPAIATLLYDDFVARNMADQLMIIEMTEHEEDDDTLKQYIDVLHRRGFRIALDNFGSGYSSLSALSAFQVDYIKIDASLVSAAANGNLAPIESAIALAKEHHCVIIAKGVETFKTLEIMRSLNVDCVQGLLFGHPVNAQEALYLQSLSIEDAVKSEPYPHCQLTLSGALGR